MNTEIRNRVLKAKSKKYLYIFFFKKVVRRRSGLPKRYFKESGKTPQSDQIFKMRTGIFSF